MSAVYYVAEVFWQIQIITVKKYVSTSRDLRIPKVSKIWKQKKDQEQVYKLCSLPFGRVYFQAGIRAIFWEIKEDKRLRDFPSLQLSKVKVRGPMIDYELWGRFPSSVLVFSVFVEDVGELAGFCCHITLVSFVNSLLTEQDPVARVVRLLLLREESSLILCSEPVRAPMQL